MNEIVIIWMVMFIHNPELSYIQIKRSGKLEKTYYEVRETSINRLLETLGSKCVQKVWIRTDHVTVMWDLVSPNHNNAILSVNGTTGNYFVECDGGYEGFVFLPNAQIFLERYANWRIGKDLVVLDQDYKVLCLRHWHKGKKGIKKHRDSIETQTGYWSNWEFPGKEENDNEM